MATRKEDIGIPADDAAADEAFIQPGRTEPDFGPSDSSDSPSDMPESRRSDAGTDRQSTGERPDVEDSGTALDADDIQPDKIVPQERAGLAHTPPDPERNGGQG